MGSGLFDNLSSALRQVKTLVPCFNNTEEGYGFTGASRIGKAIHTHTSFIGTYIPVHIQASLVRP